MKSLSPAILLLLIAATTAAPIEKDRTFGTDAKGFTIFKATGSESSFAEIALKSDGSYILCGKSDANVFVAQANAAGTVDKSGFNAPVGYQILSVQDQSSCASAAIQTDQKTVITGLSENVGTGVISMLVLRLTAAGTVDTGSFGSPNGYVLINAPTTFEPRVSEGHTIRIQPSNGYIVAAGLAVIDDVDDVEGFIARMSPDGVLDPAYGTGGITEFPFGTSSAIVGMAMQSTEKTIMLLQTDTSGSPSITMVRFDNAGAVDATFGIAGIVNTASLGAAVPQSIEVQATGGNADKPVFAAYTGNQVFVLRYSSDGLLDHTFGSSGIETVTLPFDPIVTSIAVGPDDSVFVSGTDESTVPIYSFVIKLTPNGPPDSTFGDGNGVQLLQPVVLNQDLSIADVKIDLNDLPVLAGSTGDDAIFMRLVASSTASIIIDSPTTSESPLSTNQLIIRGSATYSETKVVVTVDDVPMPTTTYTNGRGDWFAGVTAPLPYGVHTVVASLVVDVDTVLATDTAVVTLQLPS